MLLPSQMYNNVLLVLTLSVAGDGVCASTQNGNNDQQPRF